MGRSAIFVANKAPHTRHRPARKAFKETIMATTYDESLTIGTRQKSGGSFLWRVFDRYIDARQREANRQIIIYLQSLDTATLHDYGYTDAQIEAINGKKS
jgi:hypothetical protein